MNKFFKIMIIPLLIAVSITIVYIVIDYGSSDEIVGIYEGVKPDSTSGFNKALQFLESYTQATGDTSLAIKRGLSEEDAEIIASGGTTQNGGDPATNGANYNPTVSASVQEIINMSESQVWQLISEGKYSSYDEANKAAQANKTTEEKFWSGMLVQVEVPIWKWSDSSKTSKVSSTTKIQVNKHLSEYYKSFMTDLYNAPEQYVILIVGGYNFRTKNTASGPSKNYSGHSFGATLDINWNSDGMGLKDTPYKESSLSEPLKSEVCSAGSNWYNIAKKYDLDWGGNWSQKSLDPMHFSLVGDNKKDTRKFEMKVSGR
jgi:hypothetical protein